MQVDESCRGLYRLAHVAASAFSFTLIFIVVACAQERRQGEPGQFDYYILALSWSPSYCEARQDRTPDRARERQCDGRPFSFVVHGLWPQYERGFPSYCQVPAPRLDRNIVGSMLDLMPSPRLIFHEWDQHGTCSGLSPHAYFESVRNARAAVKIPPEYVDLERPISVAPAKWLKHFSKPILGCRRARFRFSATGDGLPKYAFVSARICRFVIAPRPAGMPAVSTEPECRQCAAEAPVKTLLARRRQSVVA